MKGTVFKGISVNRVPNSLRTNCWFHNFTISVSPTQNGKGMGTLKAILKTISSQKSLIYWGTWASGSGDEASKSPVSKKIKQKKKVSSEGMLQIGGWLTTDWLTDKKLRNICRIKQGTNYIS